MDDNWGTGVIPALSDALRDVEAKIVFKAAVSPRAAISAMQRLLQDEVMKLESRVFIMHLHPDLAISLFSEAYKLGIISSDYVWVITDGLASLLNSINATSLLSMNGVLGIKIKLTQTDESRLNALAKGWKQRFKAQNPTIPSLELNSRALVAYDTVCAIAIVIDNLLLESNYLTNPRDKLSRPDRLYSKNGLNIAYKIVVNSGGGSRKTPRGWVKPVPDQKLKIAVPWRPGFQQLVSVKPVHANTDAQNQTNEITGFCNDVFKAVLRRLDYELLHELIPYGFGNATAGYSDDLVYQVYLQSTPSMEYGHPYCRKKSPPNSCGSSLFSFSTLFMTQRWERIVSGLGRAVMIIWLFVDFVLVSSYTASLSAILTERQIVPKVESLESLITQNLRIGYSQGSFIGKYLEKQLGVSENVLRPYSSVQEYAIALKKGPR
ncbi:hypothetical protein SUGI_0857820 [Cryptomeria japonica]|nr:hypothetical protein SUGI_0857820 [Cryptomeria japonica]